MIGYYVHHHGSGHAHRFAAVREGLPGLVGLGSGPRPAGVPEAEWIALPHDAEGPPGRDPTAGGTLHWAPVGHAGMRARTAALARWVEAAQPRAIVVDVSVEIALAARLLSVPTVVVAQHGDRDDEVHRLAYASAAAVAALWPAGEREGPVAAGERLHEVGPISRFDDRIVSAGSRPTRPRSAPRRAALMLGEGGMDLPWRLVTETIERTGPGWEWTVLGHAPEVGGLRVDGDRLWDALLGCDVVVATAGNNCIAEAAAARRPLILVPQERPFGEQRAHADLLERRGLATVLAEWPAADAWPSLLDAVNRAPAPDWAAFHDGHGAERLAAVVEEVAAQ